MWRRHIDHCNSLKDLLKSSSVSEEDSGGASIAALRPSHNHALTQLVLLIRHHHHHHRRRRHHHHHHHRHHHHGHELMQIKRRQSCSPIPSECENEQCMQIFIAGGFIIAIFLIFVAFVLISGFTIIVANVNIIFIQVIQRSTFFVTTIESNDISRYLWFTRFSTNSLNGCLLNVSE